MIMDRLYGGVCYAGIDTDPELKYPKGAGRVAFSNQQSYIAAISARFVQLQHNDIDKRVGGFSAGTQLSLTRHGSARIDRPVNLSLEFTSNHLALSLKHQMVILARFSGVNGLQFDYRQS